MTGHVAVLGGGSWGTTLASVAAAQGPCRLWVRSTELAREINDRHTNQRYLPGIELHASLSAVSDLRAALEGASAVLVGIPSHGVRGVLEAAASMVAEDTPVFSLSKGIEVGTNLRMSEVIGEVLPQTTPGVVTGPNLALEIAMGQPAASLVACEEEEMAERVRLALHSNFLRAYLTTDVIGCEVAGATKNVLAIAVGIGDGLGFGENTRALLVARGLAEMGRLGTALGGHTLTFGGLAGVGDLVATATSDKSRNRMVGVHLGEGRDLASIIGSTSMVAEGIKTAAPLAQIAKAAGVEMPICAQVAAIVAGETTPREALSCLMERPARGEWDGLIVGRGGRR